MNTTPRPLACALVADGLSAQTILDTVLTWQRAQTVPVQLYSVSSVRDTAQKPDILPNGVKYLAPEEAAKSPVVSVVIIDGGPLSNQYNIAVTAITHGKHVVLTSATLMAAYGDILYKMAQAYHVTLGLNGVVCGHLNLMHSLEELAPFGIKTVSWLPESPLNIALDTMASRDVNFITACGIIQKMPEDMAYYAKSLFHTGASVMAHLFQQFPSFIAGKTPSPNNITLQDVKIAVKLGGTVRYVATASHNGLTVAPYFLDADHPLTETHHTQLATVDMQDGTHHTFSTTSTHSTSAQRGALSDIIKLAYTPKKMMTPHIYQPPSQEYTHLEHALVIAPQEQVEGIKKAFSPVIESVVPFGTRTAFVMRTSSMKNEQCSQLQADGCTIFPMLSNGIPTQARLRLVG